MKLIEVNNQTELDNLLDNIIFKDDYSDFLNKNFDNYKEEHVLNMNIIKINFNYAVIRKSYVNAVIHVCKNHTITDCSPNGNYIVTHGSSIINVCYKKDNDNYLSFITTTDASIVLDIYTDIEPDPEKTRVIFDSIHDNIVRVTKMTSLPWDMNWDAFVKAVANNII